MDNLSMCKAIARLEGVKVWMVGNIECLENMYCNSGGYDPISNLTINCILRDKYEVSILHCHNEAEVEIGDGEFKSLVVVECKKEDIPRAVIECILKDNNLWTGD